MGSARRIPVVALLSALAFTLISCAGEDSGGAPEREDRGSSDVPSTPSPTSFESDRHSYSLELEAGWVISEYGGEWTSLDQFTPGAEIPGEDVASSTQAEGFLVANSMPIPDGISPDDWLAELLRLTRSGRGPGCDESVDKGVLAGQQATIVEHRCEGTTVVGWSLTHGGRGYYFTIGFPADDSSAQATLKAMVGSVRFVER